MFTVFVGSILTTGLFILSLRFGGKEPAWFSCAISAWLWFTVLFANFAEAMAEGRGKAQADALRRARHDIHAKKFLSPHQREEAFIDYKTMIENGEMVEVPARKIRKGDVVLVEAGDYVPVDGEVVAGIASVDESAITGETPRSSAKAAAIAAASPAARGSCPTGSWSV